MDQAIWNIALDFYNRAGNSGGWTADIHSHFDPTEGYSVGGNPKVTEWTIPFWRNMPGPTVVQVIADYIRIIDSAGETLSGGWVDDHGTLYLDSPTVYLDRETAIALGQHRGEKAIYCLHTGETIEL